MTDEGLLELLDEMKMILGQLEDACKKSDGKKMLFEYIEIISDHMKNILESSRKTIVGSNMSMRMVHIEMVSRFTCLLGTVVGFTSKEDKEYFDDLRVRAMSIACKLSDYQ